MTDIIIILQNNIKDIITFCDNLQRESASLEKTYWSTDANTKVSALSTDDTPATKETGFTKGNYAAGITFMGQLDKFFSDQAVTTGDYLVTIKKLQYADAVLATALSRATEEVASGVLNVCNQCDTILRLGMDSQDIYTDYAIDTAIATWPDAQIIFGSSMTKEDLSDAMALITQFRNMLTNQIVTTGCYSCTISKWRRFL